MFNRWRESFIESGIAALSGKLRDNAVKTLTSENESLKKLIGELTLANDVLKKTLLGSINENRYTHAGAGFESANSHAILERLTKDCMLSKNHELSELLKKSQN